MDAVDQAEEYEQAQRDKAIAKIPRYTGKSAQDCIDCGDGIASERQLAVPGCQLCVSCASDLELRNGGRR